MSSMIRPAVLLAAVLERDRATTPGPRLRGERGQATVEYALVILGAATIALLLVAWAAKTGRISGLLDHMMDLVGQKAG
jgi:hypothetical protein